MFFPEVPTLTFRGLARRLLTPIEAPTTLEQRNRRWIAMWRYTPTINMPAPDSRGAAAGRAAESHLARQRRLALRFLSRNPRARAARLRLLRAIAAPSWKLHERPMRND
jgi:hypothetical protein